MTRASVCFRALALVFIFSLSVSAHAATNLIPNPGTETANAAGSAPVSWSTDLWGSNTSTFQYLSTGHASGRSVQVTMTARTNGDAKWYFNPVAVSPNTQYTFTEYYKANVATHIVLMTLNAAGQATYTDLSANAAAAPDWKQFSATFTTSGTAKTVSVLHVIEKKGTLALDDVSLTSGTTPPPPPTAPTCTLSANPGSIQQGSSSTLTWTTANATSFAVDNGVGTLTPVTGGSTSVSPASTITYTGTASGTGTGTCTATVTVTTTPPPPPPPNELVPNFSVETPGNPATKPANWTTSSWGTNTPTYQYITNDGHEGTHSVKVTVANYKSGDAKWYFNPVALTPGDYRFTGWYKTNINPHAVVMFIKNDGTEDYHGLQEPLVDGSGNWQKFDDTFTVPAGVQSVSVFFFIENNGYLQVDDVHLSHYTPTPFTRGLVTMVVDNGFEYNATTMLPVLDQYGLKLTYCYSTEYVEGQAGQVAYVQKIHNDGQETCSHLVHHSDMTAMTVATMDSELTHSKSYLQSITGDPVNFFITPFGAYNATVINEIKKYYSANRNTDEGFNTKENWNTYNIRVQNMKPDTTLAQFQAWVNKAKADKTWLVVVYHAVVPPGGTIQEYDTLEADFKTQMAWLSTAGITVKNWTAALAELTPQL